MKRCPTCNRVETDDALAFCRVDGTLLIVQSGALSANARTTKFGSPPISAESETSILPHTTAGVVSPATAATTVLDAQRGSGATQKSGKSKFRSPAATITVALVLALGIFAYLYFSRNTNTAIDSVAVLPFQNASGDPNMDYLSDGVTESIINSLSRIAPLKVMARSTMFRFKGRESDPRSVGKELGVKAVMTGRILAQGDDLTVSAELVNVADGTQLWGEQYNRRTNQLATVQQEIARDISERLRLKLAGDQRQLNKGSTINSAAYQSYLRGRYFWNKRSSDGLKKAIEQFQQAIDRDPNYALAYTGLADCYLLMEQYAGTPASETLPKARVAVDRALQIDNSLAEAHTSLAYIHEAQWQWAEAEQEYKRAISLNPSYSTAHHWYQIYLRAMGRFDEALAEIRRAQELDPLSPILIVNLATVYISKGDFDSALRESRRLIELDPNFSLAHETLGRIYLKQQKPAEAIAEFEKDVAADRSAYSLSSLGYAYAAAGKRDEALGVIKELEEKYKRRQALGQYVGLVYLGFGDLDQTFAWLEKDFQSRSGYLDGMMANPLFDSIRGDSRYAGLMRRMGVKQ